MQRLNIARALVAAAVALALQAPSPAADAGAATPAPPAAAPADDIEALVVTARRRSEEVQDVPLAVSVVDARTLESTGSFNVNRLQQLQPTIQFYSSNQRNSAANIRGLGAPFGLTNDGIEQGVGLYIDDVYYSRAAASTFDFLDVERLEVLRGPQGTLYGKNTTAGAINITTRAPTFEPEGTAEISVGNLGFLQSKAAISGPLIGDSVAGRLAVSASNRHGTIYNVKTTNLINEIDNFGARGQILWRVTDDLELTFAGDYNVQDPEGQGQVYVRVGSTQRPLNRQYAALAAAQNYVVPSTDPFDRVTDLDAELRARNEIGGTSVRAVWDVGSGTFTSVTSWRYWDWTPANDRDFTGLPVTTKSQNPSRQDQATQEFRYAYTGDRIDYVVGLFAYHQTLHTSGSQTQGPAASRWLLNPSGAASQNPATLDGLTSFNDIHFRNNSAALFGQLTWHVNERLRFEPGLRVNYDDKDGSYDATVVNGTGTPLTSDQRGVLAPQFYTAQFDDWNVSGDAKLSYELTPDVLAYLSYGRSFKTGGINLNGLPLDGASNPIQAAATIQPEKVNHYEAGLKTQFLGRTATLNLSAFWTDVDDFQTTVTNGQYAVVRGYLANADKVRVRGVEADFSIRPTDSFNAYVNAAVTDHEYVRFVDAPCPPELSGGTIATGSQAPGAPGVPGALSPANCDISGQWLPGISKWAVSYGAQYDFPAARLLGREGHAYVGFDGSYRTRWSSNASRSAYTDVSGYALANLRVGFRDDDRWDVYAWLRNAFDKDYFEFLSVPSGNTGLVSGQPGDPRTWGATVQIRF